MILGRQLILNTNCLKTTEGFLTEIWYSLHTLYTTFRKHTFILFPRIRSEKPWASNRWTGLYSSMLSSAYPGRGVSYRLNTKKSHWPQWLLRVIMKCYWGQCSHFSEAPGRNEGKGQRRYSRCNRGSWCNSRCNRGSWWLLRGGSRSHRMTFHHIYDTLLKAIYDFKAIIWASNPVEEKLKKDCINIRHFSCT